MSQLALRRNELLKLLTIIDMPKPKGQKNTKNKAKHSKLMANKINKKKAGVAARKEKLKAIVKRAKGEDVE